MDAKKWESCSHITGTCRVSSLLGIVGSSLQKFSIKWRQDNKTKAQRWQGHGDFFYLFIFSKWDGVSLELCIPQSSGLSVVPNKSGWWIQDAMLTVSLWTVPQPCRFLGPSGFGQTFDRSCQELVDWDWCKQERSQHFKNIYGFWMGRGRGSFVCWR